MPTLSLYGFQRSDRTGPFFYQNATFLPQTISEQEFLGSSMKLGNGQPVPAFGAVLCFLRADTEVVVNLASLARQHIRPEIDKLVDASQGWVALRNDIRVSAPVSADYSVQPQGVQILLEATSIVPDMNWINPGAPNAPFPTLPVVVAFHVDFHVNTPVGCFAAEGRISQYIAFFLDQEGKLHVKVLPYVCTNDEGLDACRGVVNGKIDQAAKQINANASMFTNSIASMLPQDLRFRQIYLLPGDGTKNLSTGSGDADWVVSLALIPQI